MCYDKESSLSSWVVANVIAIYLFSRNKNYDRWNAGFIAVFTTIQLLEAGIWWSIDQKSPNYSNELLTKFILLVLLLQPVAQSYLGAKLTRSTTLYYIALACFGVLVWTLFFRMGTSSPGQFSSSKGPGGHLVWSDSKTNNFLGGWGITLLYLVGLFAPLFFAKNYKGLPLVIVGLATAFYSTVIAQPGEFGSLWCYYGVIYSLVALAV